MPPKLKAVLRNALVAGAAALIALAVAEGALRLILPAPPRFFDPQEEYVFDAEIAHRLRPDQATFTHDKPVRTSSQGLRDTEYSPTGVRRVLALGDSQTFGNGLEEADTWPRQLERELEATSGVDWEVVNGGIPGTDTWQHEILLRRLIRTYHPSLVVLAVYPNDVSRAFAPDPARALPTGSIGNRIGYLLKRSEVFMVGLQGWNALRHVSAPSAESKRELAILEGGEDPLVAEGWAQVERSIRAMRDGCRKNAAALLVLVIPRRDQVALLEKSRAFELKVEQISRDSAIPAIDPLDALQAEFGRSGKSMFIPWDGHNTAISNRIIAHALVAPVMALGSSGG